MLSPVSRRTVRISSAELLVVLLVVISGSYFNGGASWNQNARLDAIFAFVEPGTADTGTFRIDRFLPAPERNINTGDWARVGEHYYANKAPGTILLGSLLYGALYTVQAWSGMPLGDPYVQIFDAYLLNVLISVLWLGLAALVFLRLLQRETGPPTAVLLTLGLFLGSALFPFSTQLWGHTTAAAFVLLALCALHEQGRQSALRGGFWLAAAVCTDYLALLAALGLTLGQLWRRPRDLGPLVLGALPGLGALLSYQWYCFGSPWTLATQHSNPAFMDPSRALGMFGAFDWQAWLALTVTPYRGIFLQMPILLLAPLGFYDWFRRAPRDSWLWSCLGTFVASIGLVASFNGWHGGASVCARYLIVFLPLAFLATKEIRWTRPRGVVALLLGALSLFNMLAVAAVNPLAPDQNPNPLYGYTYQALFAGQVSPYAFGIRVMPGLPEWPELSRWAMWNWGELLGLRGLWSLLPLMAVWLVLGVGLYREVKARSLRGADRGGAPRHRPVRRASAPP